MQSRAVGPGVRRTVCGLATSFTVMIGNQSGTILDAARLVRCAMWRVFVPRAFRVRARVLARDECCVLFSRVRASMHRIARGDGGASRECQPRHQR